jgi:hypothetical protein
VRDKSQPGAIRLLRAEISSAGPIGSFQEDLAPLTLLYAHNERGKTTIVENLVACLFRQRKESLHKTLRRDFIGASRVTVEGISKKPVVLTSLAGRKKLDDLIEDLGWSVPPSLFDLLVVKGAELEVLRQQGGLTRSYLKSLVSRQRLYETLRDRLPGEVGYTALEDGVLIARRRIGSYKSYEEDRARLASLEKTAERFYSSLSRAELLHSLSRKASLKQEQMELQSAKRHAAWLLHRSIEEIEAELELFDENRAEDFSALLKDYFRIKGELAEQEAESRRREGTLGNLRWLQQARRSYELASRNRAGPLQVLSFLASGFFLAGALAAFFLAPVLLPLLLALTMIAFTLAMLATFVFRKEGGPESARAEMKAIGDAFRQRFGEPIHTLADFDLANSRLDRELGKAQAVEEKLSAAQGALKGLLPPIREHLGAAGQPGAPEAKWSGLCEELKKKTRALRSNLNRYQERLRNLGVDETDYLEQAPDRQYSRQREQQILLELEELEGQIRKEQEKGQELREELIEHIGREAARSMSIATLAEALEEKREEYRTLVRDRLAEMIAGHVVAQVLESFLRLEDQHLEAALNDPRIRDLIRTFTAGRYDRVSVQEEQLLVENEAQSFPLADLSSGAREQVLLALRMGFASIVCGKQSLFLILDDAFQYSDWQRREALVRQAVKAVQSEWQVIYLTMDDDIRDRFRKAAEVLEEGKFRLIEL